MIRTYTLDCHAANPQMPLEPVCPYTGSAATFVLINLPRPHGKQRITGVTLSITNADAAISAHPATREGSSWIVTVPAAAIGPSGNVREGIIISASGVDEQSRPVPSWIVAVADLRVKHQDGTAVPGEPRVLVSWFAARPDNPRGVFICPAPAPATGLEFFDGQNYRPLTGTITLDDTVTQSSANGVKSSGIWSFVKSLLPSWLTPTREEPPTQASVAGKLPSLLSNTDKLEAVNPSPLAAPIPLIQYEVLDSVSTLKGWLYYGYTKFENIRGKPNTLSGYGITDAATKQELAGKADKNGDYTEPFVASELVAQGATLSGGDLYLGNGMIFPVYGPQVGGPPMIANTQSGFILYHSYDIPGNPTWHYGQSPSADNEIAVKGDLASKADRAALIPPAFAAKASGSYEQGELVIYNNAAYKRNSTAGADTSWVASHWTAATDADLAARLKNLKSDGFATDAFATDLLGKPVAKEAIDAMTPYAQIAASASSINRSVKVYTATDTLPSPIPLPQIPTTGIIDLEVWIEAGSTAPSNVTFSPGIIPKDGKALEFAANSTNIIHLTARGGASHYTAVAAAFKAQS